MSDIEIDSKFGELDIPAVRARVEVSIFAKVRFNFQSTHEPLFIHVSLLLDEK